MFLNGSLDCAFFYERELSQTDRNINKEMPQRERAIAQILLEKRPSQSTPADEPYTYVSGLRARFTVIIAA